MRLFFICLILFTVSLSEARIRLRKVKDAPRVCQIMKEDTQLSRPEKKILGTEKHSLIFDDGMSLIGDLGNKVCDWPVEAFSVFKKPQDATYYIDEYKNILVAYRPIDKNGFYQLDVNLNTCQISELKNVQDVIIPKCVPPKSSSKKKRSKKKSK